MCNDYKVKRLHLMLPKLNTYVKRYDGKTKWMYFLIEYNDLLKIYNTICNKVSADIKDNLIASLSTIKFFSKPKENFVVMKLHILMIKNS